MGLVCQSSIFAHESS